MYIGKTVIVLFFLGFSFLLGTLLIIADVSVYGWAIYIAAIFFCLSRIVEMIDKNEKYYEEIDEDEWFHYKNDENYSEEEL